jgi:S1-C subfamily serine protease
LAIGSPFSLDQTVTAGIISSCNAERLTSSFQQFLQTDAAINAQLKLTAGQLQGEVIGINSQIAIDRRLSRIGFACRQMTRILSYKQIVAAGRVRRGFLGLAPEQSREPFAGSTAYRKRGARSLPIFAARERAGRRRRQD